MASISPLFEFGQGGAAGQVPRGAVRVKWASMSGGDVGVGARSLGFRVLQVQYVATWGNSTLTMQGSNDSTDGADGNWVTLTDLQGNGISKTADGAESIQDSYLWVRPSFGAGTGSGLNVTMMMQ